MEKISKQTKMSLIDTEVTLPERMRDYFVFAIIFIIVFACVLCVSKIKAVLRNKFIKTHHNRFTVKDENSTDFI